MDWQLTPAALIHFELHLSGPQLPWSHAGIDKYLERHRWRGSW